MVQNIFPVDLVIEQVEAIVRLLLRLLVQFVPKFPDLTRCCQTHVNHLSLLFFPNPSEVRALGSPGITRLLRYYDPLRGPSQPRPL